MSDLERFGAILYANNLEDISDILESDMIDMEEKNKFLDDIKNKSSDKDILRILKFEDNIDYRFDLVREEALDIGISQGIEKNTKETILSMIKNDASLEFVSKVTGKSIEEIKEIANSIKE